VEEEAETGNTARPGSRGSPGYTKIDTRSTEWATRDTPMKIRDKRFLDDLSDVLSHTFLIIFGVGATLVALPVAFAILTWLIMWPLSGWIASSTWNLTPEAQSAGARFWLVWGWASLFLICYASVGWPLRAVRRAMLDGKDSREAMKTLHCEVCGQFHGSNPRVLTASWPTFWFAVAAVAGGSLVASALPGILRNIVKDLEGILEPVVMPTSRLAVAIALIATGLEWWADWWAKERRAARADGEVM